ncbi:MAG: type II secretion system F family protein [Phycisphaerae bacterium]|nr:type II secretion system F family protein [Tepidisphaeraceae bacterium]
MPVFSYKASAPATGEMSGTITADTPRQARDLLRERGLVVRTVVETREKAARARPSAEQYRAPTSRKLRRHATTFARELSTLLSVGVPLLEALDTLARQHTGRFQTVILLMRDRIAGGSTLAQAMDDHPGAFDELAVRIAEVGEDSGTLDTSLQRLAEFRERAEQLRGKIGTALIYPAIVLVLALACTVFLMTFVVPRILEPLVEQGQELPLPTRIVKSISDFLLSWWWLLAACGFAMIFAFVAFIRTKRGRHAWHRFILRLPLIGELTRKQAIVRVCVVVGTLLKSGIVFVRALQIAQRTTANLVLKDALAATEKAITAGGDIGLAIERTGAFPPMVVQVFAVGQTSGKLEEMLDRLADTYDQQVNQTANRLTAVLEPLLIICLALIVLFIVLATVLPILEAGNAIQ